LLFEAEVCGGRMNGIEGKRCFADAVYKNHGGEIMVLSKSSTVRWGGAHGQWQKWVQELFFHALLGFKEKFVGFRLWL
jgi:hypothetical protein